MTAKRTIALDAMGGDFGPEVVVPGAALSLARQPEQAFVMFGKAAEIEPLLAARPALAARTRVVHTDLTIASDEKPSQAMRRGKGTSMWLAIEAVKSGEAQAVVSGGNTGALMAMAKLILRPLPGIERPAIAALWPTVKGECIVLDVGANVGASARQLTDFALMGAAMARILFHVERPSVGLLNIGSEEIKGNEEVREAHAWLKAHEALPIAYRGFVEGNEIGQGVVDVVVVEGFAGNIALKTAEGTARQVGQYLKDAMGSSPLTRLGAVLASGGFRALKHRMDPRRVNGGMFLGLDGIAIKSHGGSDAVGFASAVDIAYEMAESGFVARLGADLAGLESELLRSVASG
jgi:glycerol-3-phosphate acyltransferase PlsX